MNKTIVTVIFCLLIISGFSQKPIPNVELIREQDEYGRESVYMTIDSVKQGLCIDYDSLGRREIESCYVDGELTGPFILYYPNGNISQKSYVMNGGYHGVSIGYYHDGKIEFITHYKMGLKDGVKETYIEDGRLDKRLLYRNDTLIRILEDHHYIPLPPTIEPLEKD